MAYSVVMASDTVQLSCGRSQSANSSTIHAALYLSSTNSNSPLAFKSPMICTTLHNILRRVPKLTEEFDPRGSATKIKIHAKTEND